MVQPMIGIKNVSKWYGSVQVLHDCSVSVNKGDVVVVCGPSGSGNRVQAGGGPVVLLSFD